MMTLLDAPGNDNPELRRAASGELEVLRREIQSKRPPKGPRAPVAAKQK
jgi:hypothetical protein